MTIHNMNSECGAHRRATARSGRSAFRVPRSEFGFTLAELMVVITVMILLLTVAAPNVGKMMTTKRADAGLGAIKAAVATARAYAGENPPFSEGTYQGVALMVAPANEMRLIQHREAPASGGTKLVNLATPEAGYVDTADPYVTIPEGVGLAGLTRNNTGAPRIIMPPFVVRFDRHGHQIVRAINSGSVVYDGNYNNNYEYGSTRPAAYNYSAFDPEQATTPPTQTSGKYNLPFEKIEFVAGVVAYSKQDLAAAGLSTTAASSEIPTATRDWILANGKTLFFNRYTGDALPQ